jgi:hypothetical protein
VCYVLLFINAVWNEDMSVLVTENLEEFSDFINSERMYNC